MNIDELVSKYSSGNSIAPHPALDQIDELDWANVRDAYGPGTKVPAMLRALNSSEPIHRSYAIQALCEHIWHQGTVYSATAKAVPVLFQMLSAEDTKDKASIAFLLSIIADGKPPFADCEDDPEQAARWRKIINRSGRSFDAELAEGKEYGAEIRHQILTQMSLLYPFIRDPDVEVRHAVVVALGCFPEIASRFESDLREALENESDQAVRAELTRIVGGREID